MKSYHAEGECPIATLEEQKEVVKKLIDKINEKIITIEKHLIIAEVEELPDTSIKNIHDTMKRLAKEEEALKYIQVDLRELYYAYALYLELEAEQRRGELDKRR